jgi:hypothetical protein
VATQDASPPPATANEAAKGGSRTAESNPDASPSLASTPPDVAIKEGYPSTDMSKELLKVLQTETKTYKRNKKASGAIFVQSHAAYEAIIGLITKIEAQTSLVSLPWDDFDKSYTSTTELEK